MHRTQKNACASSSHWGMADSLSLDTPRFTLIVWLTGFDQPRPKRCTPQTFPVLHSLMCPSTETQKQQCECLVPFQNPQDGVSVLAYPTNTYTQNCPLVMPACVGISGGVRSCSTRHPITASFTRQVRRRKTESVTGEIRWTKRKETAGPVSGCDTVWPFADAKRTLGGGSQGRALRWGQTHPLIEVVHVFQDHIVQFFADNSG